MNGRRAFFAFGFWVLAWIVFWHGAIRTVALRYGNKPWARGLLFDV